MRNPEGKTVQKQIEKLTDNQATVNPFMDFMVERLPRWRRWDGQLGKFFQ